ncbi:hypothetical protein R3W88_022661 [Solanum pinnatisectum]|uniref:Major facilitator superfamily (MFS) profile domain-containing protein n=1 Tax=Solanum pinnatisectum TaxID=50273 RepID=A0AAV9LW84_9SOLN|nr:hypothetical protein R3W88_022661 [Solanum pinnatisectum]
MEYFLGFITDCYGRRKGLLSIVIVSALCAALSTFSPNYNSLLVVRIMVGVGVGGVPVYGSWFHEFVPSQKRGMWMIICTCFWTIGTLLEPLLALMILPRLGWRWPLALSSIPSFVELLLFVFTVVSPRYLCAMAVVNKTQLPPGKLVSSQLTKELHSPGKNKISSVKSGFSSLLVLLSPALHRNTLLIWVVYIGTNSPYYAIILLTSLFSSEQCQHSLIAFHTKDDQSLFTNVLINTLAVMYALYFLFLLPLLAPQLSALTTTLLFGARCHQMAAIRCFEAVVVLAVASVLLISVETKGRELYDTLVV